MNQKLGYWWRAFWFIALALFIFIYSESYQRYIKIEEFTDSIHLDNDEGIYYDITRNYPSISIEGFDSILGKIISRFKYSEICFRDEGSRIKEEAFKGSNLMVSVTYSNQTTQVSNRFGRSQLDFSEEKCFKITNKQEITWNWEFSSDMQITQGFLEVKEFRSFVISPNVATYLKINNIYLIIVGLLSLFYSGVFLWALTRIWKYLKEGFR